MKRYQIQTVSDSVQSSSDAAWDVLGQKINFQVVGRIRTSSNQEFCRNNNAFIESDKGEEMATGIKKTGEKRNQPENPSDHYE